MRKEQFRKMLACVTVISAIFMSLTGTVLAATDNFLKIDGIPGESTDARHKSEIDVISWSWGEKTAIQATAVASTGRASFQDITITKYVDKASPVLMRYAAQGRHIPQTILVVRQAGSNQIEFLKLKSSDCIVTSVSPGNAAKDNWPMENITINCVKHEYEYVPRKPDGSTDASIKTILDLKSMTFQ